MSAGPVSRQQAGWLAAAVVLALYGGLAVSVDFPRTAIDIQSDEATYYLMGHSLAADGDLEYRREDLERVWKEFPRGPNGVFLKTGRDVTGVGVTSAPPFVAFPSLPDPDKDRLYYGKSFIYPLVAAPFVWLAGTNGFLILNALLLAGAVLVAYTFVSARSGIAIGLVIGSAFVFASVVPVYFVWITPELFNFAIGLLAGFCWLYKYVATEPPGRGRAWLRQPTSDIVAALLVGILTFSKVTNVLLLAPVGVWLLWRRQWKTLAAVSLVWLVVTAALFGANVAVSGEWSYQGGERATCYNVGGKRFPFQEKGVGLEECSERARNTGLGSIIFDREMFWHNLRANAVYFFVGRNSGLVAYFFPAVFAMGAFLLARGHRAPWQWLLLAGVLIQMLVFIISLPYTYFGGGGSVGNRYFMGVYGMCVFLLPPVRSVRLSLLPWVIGGLFMAKLVLNPFYTSIYPGRHSQSGPLRWLPVELTNVNDLPLITEGPLMRRWFGPVGQGDAGFQIYYLDANSYLVEDDRSFWIRGDSRAEMLLKTDRPFQRLDLTLKAGPVPTRTTVKLGSVAQTFDLAAGESRVVSLSLPPGFRYRFEIEQPPKYIWTLSVSSSHGFTPSLLPDLKEPSPDVRFLGVNLKPVMWP